MNKILTFFATALLAIGCSSTLSPQAPATQAPAVLDYGDHTSQTLTTNAWKALIAGNYEHAIKYTEKCAELYEDRARAMQASLKAKAHIDKVHDYWALNDVGTSYFIKGEALTKLGKKNEAVAAYKVVRDELFYAQAWDPKGWFWSPADAAYPKINALSGDF
ncbi:MAG: beta-glucanase precursor [Gammaproteobacteria bacterium]|nr:beta-glucanase precursor [Gammaproteobacteria bacterium]